MSTNKLVKQEVTEEVKYKDFILYDIIVVGVIWTVSILLKLICEDEEWGLFLMVTAMLLLNLFPFSLTRSVVKTTVTEVKDDPSDNYAPLYKEDDKKDTGERNEKDKEANKKRNKDISSPKKPKKTETKTKNEFESSSSSEEQSDKQEKRISVPGKRSPKPRELEASETSSVSSETDSSSSLSGFLRISRKPKPTFTLFKQSSSSEKTLTSSSDEHPDTQARRKFKSKKRSPKPVKENVTSVVIEEDIFVKKIEETEIKTDNEDSNDLERSVQARLEITDLPPENIGEDPKQDVKMEIVVDKVHWCPS